MPDQSLPDPAAFDHCVVTRGAAATRALGEGVAGLLRGGEIVLLYGPLGAGKTCFCQGVGHGLGRGDEIVSPTFTLVNTYPGTPVLHHLDFYRVDDDHDLADIGVPDLLDEVWDGRATVLVEWPAPLLPALGETSRVELLVLPGAAAVERRWHLRGVPEPPAAWVGLFAGGGTPC